MSPSQSRPTRVMLVQTQAEMAGAQEISRILGEGLGREPDRFEVHNLFLYRKTSGCDDFPNVRFVARERPSGPLDAARFVSRLFGTMREIGPDVVLAFQHYGNIVAAPVARMTGVRKIVANHVSAPATISSAVRRVDRWMGLAGFYDVITVNSMETWRDYANYPPRYAGRIVHVPHGFAERTTSLTKAQARAQFSLPQNASIIGTVARLHPLKRIDQAIRALKALPDVHLAIAGQGPDAPRLRELAASLGLASRVHFAGEMPSRDIGDFLAALDAFVFPSIAETFGLAAVEAAQAGIPVVASDLPVLREVLAHDGQPAALFVDASNDAKLAAAISNLLGDPALSDDLSRRGRLLSRRYSTDAMVDAYRRIILEERPPVMPREAPVLAGSGRSE